MQITNVMDWTNATKIHTPPSVKRYFPNLVPRAHVSLGQRQNTNWPKDTWALGTWLLFPPPPPWRACAIQRKFRDREWRTIESHCWHEDRCSRLLIHCCSLTKAQSGMPLRPKAVVSDTLFPELYVIRVFSFYFAQLIVKVWPDEHCIPAFWKQILAVTSPASSE